MLWAVLLQSEYRRIKKAVLEIAGTNPIILVAIVAVAVGGLALALRAADSFVIFTILPGGLSGVIVFLLLIGLIFGLTFSLVLPKEAFFDEQFRLVPVRKADLLIGLRGLPFVLLVGVIGVPIFAMTWRMYALLGVPAHGVWAGVFGMLYLAAALQGASIQEALRGHRSWRLFWAGTLALLGTLALSVALLFGVQGSWSWFATYLPMASFDIEAALEATGTDLTGSISDAALEAIDLDRVIEISTPPILVAVTGAATSIILSAVAWIAYSLRPDAPPRRKRIEFSAPMGKSVPAAFTAWATLTTLREGQTRSLLALAVTVGIGTALVFSWLSNNFADAMGLLVVFMILYLAAPVGLLFSESRTLGIWLLKTVPASGTSVGLAWWISTSLLTVAVGVAALAPFLAVFVRESALAMGLMLALIVIASSTTLVGRLVPWSRESPARQLFAGLALMVASVGGYYAAITIGGLAGRILGETILIIPIIGLLLLVGTGALSAAIEWLDS